MKMIKVKIDTLISKLEEIKASGHETVHLSIVEGVQNTRSQLMLTLMQTRIFVVCSR